MYQGIVLFGPPGVGKSTQGRLLAEQPKYIHLSTGDMLRNLNPESDIGSRVLASLAEGNLAPDPLVFELFFDNIEKAIRNGTYNPLEQYLVLDGIPRKTNQIEIINKQIDVIQFFYLDAEEEILKQRLLNRPDKRPEDNPQSIKKRLDIYHAETAPVAEHYNTTPIVASADIDKVHNTILAHLTQLSH